YPCNGGHSGIEGLPLLHGLLMVFPLQLLVLLHGCKDHAHSVLGLMVCSQDLGEGLLASRLVWVPHPLDHRCPPTAPCPLCPWYSVPTPSCTRTFIVLHV
ncbi:hypothetical protein NDU88_002601, partial [Pleurodeles waltl]